MIKRIYISMIFSFSSASLANESVLFDWLEFKKLSSVNERLAFIDKSEQLHFDKTMPDLSEYNLYHKMLVYSASPNKDIDEYKSVLNENLDIDPRYQAFLAYIHYWTAFEKSVAMMTSGKFEKGKYTDYLVKATKSADNKIARKLIIQACENGYSQACLDNIFFNSEYLTACMLLNKYPCEKEVRNYLHAENMWLSEAIAQWNESSSDDLERKKLLASLIARTYTSGLITDMREFYTVIGVKRDPRLAEMWSQRSE